MCPPPGPLFGKQKILLNLVPVLRHGEVVEHVVDEEREALGQVRVLLAEAVDLGDGGGGETELGHIGPGT